MSPLVFNTTADAPLDTTRADRAARRSAWIGFLTLSLGTFVWLLIKSISDAHNAATHHRGNKPTAVYLSIIGVMLLATIVGLINALRALGGGTTRTGYAVVGLLLNGLFVLAFGIVVVITIFGMLIWSTMGR